VSNAKRRSEIIPNVSINTYDTSAEHGDAPPPSAPARMGWARRHPGIQYRTVSPVWRHLEDHRRPFDRLRTGVEHPNVISKILTHLGLPSEHRPDPPTPIRS